MDTRSVREHVRRICVIETRRPALGTVGPDDLDARLHCADRVGRTIVTSAAMVISGSCCLVIGLLFGANPIALLIVAAIWGASVVADSAQFSACVTELGDPQYIGTALTNQTSFGFLLTTISIELIPHFENLVSWRYAFTILAIGPLFGVISMLRLRSLPEAEKIAHGRR